MVSKVENLYEKAMQLDEEERRQLIRLLADVGHCGESEAEIEREWNAEAVRRYQEYKDGKVEAIPADDVFHRMEDRYAK